MSGLLDSATSALSRIGRYFSVVSILPGLLLVLNLCFLVGLLKEDPSTFSFLSGWMFLVHLHVSGWVAVVATAIVVGLLLHPFQYALTQLFEGYWGAGRLARALASSRILRHRQRAAALEAVAAETGQDWLRKAHRSRPSWVRAAYRGARNEFAREQLALERLHAPEMDFLIPTYFTSQATEKALLRYPMNHGRIMPTRLGNILRRHEDTIGSDLGLDAIAIAPFLSQVAPEKELSRVDDEGEQMDLALRLSVTFLITTICYALALAPRGPWALVALAPYVLAYVTYRGACYAAENYMTAVAVMVHLNRFSLYTALHLGLPKDVDDERRIAAQAMALIADAGVAGEWRYR